MKHEFYNAVRELITSGAMEPYLDDLNSGDRMALTGIYIQEEYPYPNDMEPIVESLGDKVNEPSPLALKLYAMMAEGWISDVEKILWVDELIERIEKEHSGCVEEKINDALRMDEDEAGSRLGFDR